MQSKITLNHYKQIITLRRLYKDVVKISNNIINSIDAIELLEKYSEFVKINHYVEQIKSNNENVLIDDLIELCYSIAEVIIKPYDSFTESELKILRMLAIHPLHKLYALAVGQNNFDSLLNARYINYNDQKLLYYIFTGDLE